MAILFGHLYSVCKSLSLLHFQCFMRDLSTQAYIIYIDAWSTQTGQWTQYQSFTEVTMIYAVCIE